MTFFYRRHRSPNGCANLPNSSVIPTSPHPKNRFDPYTQTYDNRVPPSYTIGKPDRPLARERERELELRDPSYSAVARICGMSRGERTRPAGFLIARARGFGHARASDPAVRGRE